MDDRKTDGATSVYGEGIVNNASPLPVKAALFLCPLSLHHSLPSSLRLPLPHQMHLQIITLRSYPSTSLLISTQLWGAQVCNLNRPIFMHFPCSFLRSPDFFFFLLILEFRVFMIEINVFLLMGFPFLSDYWMVLKKIQDSCRNSTIFLPGLRYIQGNADTFGGNFSTQKRISYFDHRDDGKEVPCGFMKEFSISKSGEFA